MKKIFLLLCLSSCFAGFAQLKQGTVVYERTMMINRPPGMDPEMAKRLPTSRTDQFELLFANNRTIWQILPSAQGDETTISSGGGGMATFRMAGNNDVIFFDLNEKKRVDHREMFDREFVVDDTIQKINWKLTDETRTILNYKARKATGQRIGTRMMSSMENGEFKRTEVADTTTIIAWFTTDIPVPSGPQEFQGQLPGLILELNMNNGRMIYTAKNVSEKVNTSHIKEPKKGKRMTSTEFVKERDALMQEMRRNMPAGSNQIRIQQ